jgi:hypothetical protein
MSLIRFGLSWKIETGRQISEYRILVNSVEPWRRVSGFGAQIDQRNAYQQQHNTTALMYQATSVFKTHHVFLRMVLSVDDGDAPYGTSIRYPAFK